MRWSNCVQILPFCQNPTAARPKGGRGAEAPGDLWFLSIAGKEPAGGMTSRYKHLGKMVDRAPAIQAVLLPAVPAATAKHGIAIAKKYPAGT